MILIKFCVPLRDFCESPIVHLNFDLEYNFARKQYIHKYTIYEIRKIYNEYQSIVPLQVINDNPRPTIMYVRCVQDP